MSKWLKILLPLVILFVVIGGGSAVYLLSQFQPADLSQTKKSSFVVSKGESASEIGAALEEKGIIKSGLAFRLLVIKNHLEGKIQSGSFLLSPSMSVQQIALELTTAPTSARITVKEGLRREEMADFLANSELTKFDKEEFLTLTKNKEGYLFPDTYILSKESTTQVIYGQLTSTFDKKVTTGMADEIAASGHSLDELVTMASLVQREARGPQGGSSDPAEMKMIAGILWKRIELGMVLNVDATLQYLKGYDAAQKSWWSTSGIVAMKTSSSAYNSYKVAGLPPTPICNPGPYALQAAMNPTKSDYLFYLHDNNGKVHYARTLDEQTQNVNTYLR